MPTNTKGEAKTQRVLARVTAEEADIINRRRYLKGEKINDILRRGIRLLEESDPTPAIAVAKPKARGARAPR